MRILTYTPHGAIPDLRGFSPAIVASYFSRHLKVEHLHVCAQETYLLGEENHPSYGKIIRLKEGLLYRALFRKITRLDPYPLYARCAKIARKFKPDIIHVHQLEFPVAAFRKNLGYDVKIVIHAHAIRHFDPKLGLADAYIAVSDYTRDALIKSGFPSDRVHVLHNGADTELFSPSGAIEKAKLRENWQVPLDRKVVAYVGRKQETKGFYIYLKTLEKLIEQMPDVVGVAAGPDEGIENDLHCKEMQALRQKLVAEGSLIDIPALAHKKLAEIFKLTDVLLFPTRFSGEQHPLVLIEAMASGCIVLTTKTAGIVETVKHGVNAFLVDNAEDSELWVKETLPILANLDSCVALRGQARETAKCYDWAVLAEELRKFYLRLLEGKTT